MATFVLVDFPFPAGVGSKVRPALVVQNDKDNARLVNTVVLQITSMTSRSAEATQVLIEIATPAGKQSGLAFDSVVNCVNIATLDFTRIRRKLGTLPASAMLLVDEALEAALGIH